MEALGNDGDPFGSRHNILMTTLEGHPLSFQLDQFVGGTTLNNEDLGLRSRVLRDLFNVISTRFPRCKIFPFGSFVTLLGDRESDLDIYVDAYAGQF